MPRTLPKKSKICHEASLERAAEVDTTAAACWAPPGSVVLSPSRPMSRGLALLRRRLRRVVVAGG